MRRSNRRRPVTLAVVLVVPLLLSACAAAATPPPARTAVPTPVVTPDPHLAAPASVDEVFVLLGSAGLRITPNTATAGKKGDDLIKRINATYESWPLSLSEFTSAEALKRAARFVPDKPPVFGESPYIVAGLNILIEYGPQVTNKGPQPPEDVKRRAMGALVAALDPLLGPLAQRSVEPIPLPVATPLPGSSAAATSASPSTARP